MKLAHVGLIFVFLMLLSCDRNSTVDNHFNIDPYYGYADLLIGLDSLDFKPYAKSSNANTGLFSLNLFYFTPYGILRGQLGISNIPKYKGFFEITNGIVYGSSDIGASYFFWHGDGDIGGDIFDCGLTQGLSYINVSEFDPLNLEIRGNFTLNVVRNDTTFVSNPEIPDTFGISGVFMTKLDYE